MTGVSECSQQRGNLKDNGYMMIINSRQGLRYPEVSDFLMDIK
ncbi:hypothetical protein [Photorhabdus sp. RW14-46]|nr:hypothetical protein [Photorhabdus sp. RW14-46]